MPETILVKRGQQLRAVPRATWEQHLAQIPEHGKARLAFMSEDYHRVRNFVVREMPRIGRPIAPAQIAEELRLSPGRVQTILDELERHLFFLVRNADGNVEWAYPVTMANTPHRLTFSTGERLNAA
jgi:hypothetical protein